ncbi:hypothetical protein YUYDRAFT_05054 [Streptomyces sp. ScaeMP-e48]|uniref:hypothetical protein n=1 Tax=Streptomyces sp. ScaeMP-e48 TaxID=1100823 RepID=UPI000823CFBB|nr:hypothetical protein [Streptomyces sp. ScaeMP-e48]SCK40965.1 hypothetical protein YUYDRAFT_05054 [Streptomyces sp. ScaeMP-e48]
MTHAERVDNDEDTERGSGSAESGTSEVRTPKALPGPVEAIRLSYSHDEDWWDSYGGRPEIWYASADLVDHDTNEVIEHVGDFEFYRADPYETGDLFGVLDGHDGDVGLVAGAILNLRTREFRDDLDGIIGSFGSAMLILNSATMNKEWRGTGVGTVLAGRAIKRLGTGCRGVACYPAPLDDPGESQNDGGRENAHQALRRSWERLGFEHYRKGVYVLDLGTVTLGRSLASLTKQVDALPQPDLDAWIDARTEE